MGTSASPPRYLPPLQCAGFRGHGFCVGAAGRDWNGIQQPAHIRFLRQIVLICQLENSLVDVLVVAINHPNVHTGPSCSCAEREHEPAHQYGRVVGIVKYDGAFLGNNANMSVVFGLRYHGPAPVLKHVPCLFVPLGCIIVQKCRRPSRMKERGAGRAGWTTYNMQMILHMPSGMVFCIPTKRGFKPRK